MRHVAVVFVVLLSGLVPGCFNSHGHVSQDGQAPFQDAGLDGPGTGDGRGTGGGTGGTISGSGGKGGVGGGSGGGPGAAGGAGTGGASTAGAGGRGGVPATGGVMATGGMNSTGGVATGGNPATGGVTATGGITSTGGVPATGGAPAACQGSSAQCSGSKIQTCVGGQWGPSSDCPSHQACTGAPGAAKCTCNVDPLCRAAGNTCVTTSMLATCAQDANGCFYPSFSTDCGVNRTCSGSACMCTAGTMDCGASGCLNVNGTDPNHCGSCSTVCTAGQSCIAGKCNCAKGAPACGGCLAWDLEGASTAAPWSRTLTPDITSPNGATNIALTQSKVHGGSSALIAPVLIDLLNTNVAEVSVALPCKFNLAGYAGSAYVYLASSVELTDFTNQLIIDTWDSAGTKADHSVPFFGNIPINQWFKVELGFLSSTPVDHIGIVLTPSSNWTGAMYVDDVVINGL